MKKIRRILLLLHFSLVFITVSHLFELINWNPLSDIIGIYSSYSYANRNFGFFAPTVNEDYVLRLKTFAKNDTTGRNFPLYQPDTENKIRYLTMLWHFTEDNSTSQMDLYSRSWGLYCMNSNSTVQEVKISLSKNKVPSMKQYRAGERVTNSLYYQTTIYAK